MMWTQWQIRDYKKIGALKKEDIKTYVLEKTESVKFEDGCYIIDYMTSNGIESIYFGKEQVVKFIMCKY